MNNKGVYEWVNLSSTTVAHLVEVRRPCKTYAVSLCGTARGQPQVIMTHKNMRCKRCYKKYIAVLKRGVKEAYVGATA